MFKIVVVPLAPFLWWLFGLSRAVGLGIEKGQRKKGRKRKKIRDEGRKIGSKPYICGKLV